MGELRPAQGHDLTDGSLMLSRALAMFPSPPSLYRASLLPCFRCASSRSIPEQGPANPQHLRYRVHLPQWLHTPNTSTKQTSTQRTVESRDHKSFHSMSERYVSLAESTE
jgi:hypothetical protein